MHIVLAALKSSSASFCLIYGLMLFVGSTLIRRWREKSAPEAPVQTSKVVPITRGIVAPGVVMLRRERVSAG